MKFLRHSGPGALPGDARWGGEVGRRGRSFLRKESFEHGLSMIVPRIPPATSSEPSDSVPPLAVSAPGPRDRVSAKAAVIAVASAYAVSSAIATWSLSPARGVPEM